MIYAGIDPGLQGWVCVLGKALQFYPCPLLEDDFDPIGMSRISQTLKDFGTDLVVIEKQQAFPEQGLASTWKNGFGFGLWVGVLTGAGLPLLIVRPREWKGPMGLSADKRLSIQKAQELSPGTDFRPLETKPRARVPDHNKAEAFLLAVHGRKVSAR